MGASFGGHPAPGASGTETERPACEAGFMAPKLKVFRTHLGFYDLIVAAPSQKAALEAWGAGRDLFSQGFAAVVTEPDLAEAALNKPGVVLRRQFGSQGDFRENAEALRAPKESPESAAARVRERAE